MNDELNKPKYIVRLKLIISLIPFFMRFILSLLFASVASAIHMQTNQSPVTLTTKPFTTTEVQNPKIHSKEDMVALLKLAGKMHELKHFAIMAKALQEIAKAKQQK